MRAIFPIVVPLLFLPPFCCSQTTATFCDLVRNPTKYNGKQVTVRVTHRYGEEWSELYCLDCLDRGKAWLDVPWDIDEAKVKAMKKAPKWAGIVNLTVQGIFWGEGHYGHMNGYHYQITAQRITEVAVISKGMKSLAEEEKAGKRWACGGTNPK